MIENFNLEFFTSKEEQNSLLDFINKIVSGISIASCFIIIIVYWFLKKLEILYLTLQYFYSFQT
jgi:hypothetical protein